MSNKANHMSLQTKVYVIQLVLTEYDLNFVYLFSASCKREFM